MNEVRFHMDKFDSLSAFRGLVFGLLFSAVLWTVAFLIILL